MPQASRVGSEVHRRHDKGISAWIRAWFGQVHGHVAIGLEPSQQQLHQGPVIEDPANAVMVSIGRCQVPLVEENAGVGDPVPQIQVTEGHQGIAKVVPKAHFGQQPAAGMGDGVCPTSGLKFRCSQRVKQDHALALKAEGKSCEGAGGTSAQT